MTKRKVPPVAPEEPTESAAEAPSEATVDQAGETVAVAAEEQDQSNRRQLVLIAILACMAIALLSFSAWYILFRKPISELPLPGLTAEQMPGYGYSLYGAARPTGIAVTADGSRIYVTQTDGDSVVLAMDNHGTVLATMRPPDTATDHVFVYVAVNPLNGEVYVTDRPATEIYIYSPDGEYLRTFDPPATLSGWQPLGIGFDPAGSMFVTDPSLNVVHEFAPDGVLVRTIGQTGQFSFPNSAVEDGAGRLYVADSNNGRVVVLDQSGAQMAVVRRGPDEGDMGLPRGMSIDDQGRLYVVDSVDQSVKVYRPATDASGAPVFLGRFGTHGTGDGAFRYPNAVATDARGRVYVADWDNDRVQVWTY